MAKPKSYSITEALEAVEVDLWGHKYRSKPATRSTQKKLDDLYQSVQEVDEDESDEVVRALAQMLELLVEPVKEDGKRPPAVEKLVLKKWEGDELPFANLVRLTYGLAESQRPI